MSEENGEEVLDCVVIDKLVLPVLQQHLALRGSLHEFANIECWATAATAAVGQNVLTKCNQGMLPQCKGPGMRLVASEVEVQEFKQIGAMVFP